MLLKIKHIYNTSINLDDILKNVDKEKQYTIPIFIPHLGCKHQCVFCNQRKISGNLKCPSTEEIITTIEEHLKYFENSKEKIQIAFFGGSFTGIDIHKQEEYLKIAYSYIEEGKVDSIRLSTRPDYINDEILQLLKRYKVKSIELGVQTMNEDVLIASKRGHTSKDVISAAKLITLYGFDLGFQIMIGLPKSTVQKEVETINELLKYSPKELRIYPVYVINPSELYDMYLDGRYKPLTMEDAIYRSYMVMKQCQKSDIKVIRIGLQTTSEITQKNSEIIGPVCDNFAEYVLAKLVLDKLEEIINGIKNKEPDIDEIMFNLDNKKFESIIIGPKKINQRYIINKYGILIKTNKVS